MWLRYTGIYTMQWWCIAVLWRKYTMYGVKRVVAIYRYMTFTYIMFMFFNTVPQGENKWVLSRQKIQFPFHMSVSRSCFVYLCWVWACFCYIYAYMFVYKFTEQSGHHIVKHQYHRRHRHLHHTFIGALSFIENICGRYLLDDASFGRSVQLNRFISFCKQSIIGKYHWFVSSYLNLFDVCNVAKVKVIY